MRRRHAAVLLVVVLTLVMFLGTGAAGAGEPRCSQDAAEPSGSYMVKDPAKGVAASRIDRLLHSYPQVFERVGKFGRLELFRVYPDRVTNRPPHTTYSPTRRTDALTASHGLQAILPCGK